MKTKGSFSSELHEEDVVQYFTREKSFLFEEALILKLGEYIDLEDLGFAGFTQGSLIFLADTKRPTSAISLKTIQTASLGNVGVGHTFYTTLSPYMKGLAVGSET